MSADTVVEATDDAALLDDAFVRELIKQIRAQDTAPGKARATPSC